mgnify:CR=1 FL=1
MKSAVYNSTDKQNLLEEITKYEVLMLEHSAIGNGKQAEYCDNRVFDLTNILSKLCGSLEIALNEINKFSEKNYNAVEAKVLNLTRE